MSRSVVTPHDPRYHVFVGWDTPLRTFFAEVWDTQEVDEDDDTCAVLLTGTALEDVVTVEALQAHLDAFATLPAALGAQLRADQRQAPPRRPFQESMVWLCMPGDTLRSAEVHGTPCLSARGDPLCSGAYLRRLGAFILAQVFHPAQAAAAAGQVYIPATDVPTQCWSRRRVDWITMEEMIEVFGGDIQDSGIYEVFVEQFLRRLARHTATWPPVRRDAARVYCRAVFGVDCTDPVQMAEAKRAAVAALYGVEEEDMEEEEDDEQAYGSRVDERPF